MEHNFFKLKSHPLVISFSLIAKKILHLMKSVAFQIYFFISILRADLSR